MSVDTINRIMKRESFSNSQVTSFRTIGKIAVIENKLSFEMYRKINKYMSRRSK